MAKDREMEAVGPGKILTFLPERGDFASLGECQMAPWPVISNTKENVMTTKSEVLKAIRFQCEECMGSMLARKREYSQEARNLVIGCTAPECSLFPYRMGKDPWPKKKILPETQRKGLAALHRARRKPKISTISP